MTDQPQEPKPESESSVTNVSGGTNLDAARDINIDGDVVGRDKILSAGDDIVMGDQVEAETYIEHATIIQDRTNRLWLAALAGVVGVIIIVLGVVATRPGTAPAPVLTVLIPTSPPTGTPLPNTPTPTATPIFAKDVPYRVAIAKFNQQSDRKLAIEQRLEDDLTQQLEAAGLGDEVEVKVISQPVIESAEDAEQLAESTRSSVVIWGLYDDVGIRLRISLGSQAGLSQTMPSTARFGELPLAAAGSETGTLSFYITSTLPANTSFLSFYVLGHLYYLSNQYAKGHAAFDAAMQQLPNTVAVENEALLHFFNARAIETHTYTDTLTAACEYGQAIEKDPRMFEAYNNLGVLIENTTTSDPAESRRLLSGYLTLNDLTTACPTLAKLPSLEPQNLFSQTVQLRPDWAPGRYNLAAADWGRLVVGDYSADLDRSVLQARRDSLAGFQAALKLDPSIGGAYMSLGNMAVWDGDFVTATHYFSKALQLLPNSDLAAANLAQALALANRPAEALNAYQTALRLGRDNQNVQPVVHLALGNLYEQQGKLEQALQQYQQAQEDYTNLAGKTCEQINGHVCTQDELAMNRLGYRYAGECELSFLLARQDIRAQAWMSATQRLEAVCRIGQMGENPLGNILTGLLYEIQKDPRASQFTQLSTLARQDPTQLMPFVTWAEGNIAGMVMNDLVQQCQSSTTGDALNPCLLSDPQRQVDAIYDLLAKRVYYALFFNNKPLLTGAACPYIFTYDSATARWKFDTTILYRLVGASAETTQVRRLARFDGKLILREVEAEISYVDMIAVRLISTDGREIMLKLKDPLLGAADRRYLVLHQGDEHLLTFDVPDEGLPIHDAWVIATGYYIPWHPE